MEYYLALFTFAIVGTITPGPNNIMLVSSGVNHGVLRSVPHLLGICIGFPLMVAAIGLGMGVVFSNYPHLHKIISILGISYLLYLAWKIANAGNPKFNDSVRAPLTFFQAAAFQWVNPKAWLLATGAIAAFSVPGQLSKSVGLIVVAYVVSGSLCMGFWLLVGASMQGMLNNEQRLRYFNMAMAGLLVLSVIPMLVASLEGSA